MTSAGFHLFFFAAIAAYAADDRYATALFKKHCATCHESGNVAAARIPPMATLRAKTPVAILRTLESGVMKAQAAPLSASERQLIANLLGVKVTTERKRDEISNPCPGGSGMERRTRLAELGARPRQHALPGGEGSRPERRGCAQAFA